MKTNILSVPPLLLGLLILPGSLLAAPTSITYQGRLTDGGSPATGIYDLVFQLYSTPAPFIDPVSLPLTNSAVAVTNGLFTVSLDFQPAEAGFVLFDGNERWLEIAVRTNGSVASYTVLNPRQPITSAPYALKAFGMVGEIDGGLLIAGSVNGTRIQPGTLSSTTLGDGAVTAAKIANGQVVRSLNGLRDNVSLAAGPGIGLVTNGGRLEINALPSTNTWWSLSGNASTTPGANFLGTTDNQPLEIRVNGQRVLRLEPSITSPNVIGGLSGNFVSNGIFGAAIGGGGSPLLRGTNQVLANFGTIAGGRNNTAGGISATVGGGQVNSAIGNYAAVGGGRGNSASNEYATVSGGRDNTARSDYATIGGGEFNTAVSEYATIGGGRGNFVGSALATVGGGQDNNATGAFSGIGGGTSNVVIGAGSAIAGGGTNIAAADFSAIGGGERNTIATNAVGAVIGGGRENQARGSLASVGGGGDNDASGAVATIAGGRENTASGPFATVGGGDDNAAFGLYATIGGGTEHYAIADYSTVAGGENNNVSGIYGTIGGGANNDAGADYATVPGGLYNEANGSYSFAAGLNARASHNRSFVFSSRDNPAPSFAPERFQIHVADGFGVDFDAQRPDGGGSRWVYIGRAVAGQQIATSTGAYLSDVGIWQNASDRNRKTDFAPVNSEAILRTVIALPISSWRFTNEMTGLRHLGPTAQDFHTAFNLGSDDQSIGTVDADGVALAAIQGLNQKLAREMEQRDAENTELRQRLARLEELVSRRAGESE